MGILNRVLKKVLTGQGQSWQTKRVWVKAHNQRFTLVSLGRFGRFVKHYNSLITGELSIISGYGISVAKDHRGTCNKDRPR